MYINKCNPNCHLNNMDEQQSSSAQQKVKSASAKPKRKLKPGMGKQKGNAFEGVIAKKLTAAVAPLTFIRTPGSGARAGGKNFELYGKMFGADALKIFVGDVVPTNERDTGLSFKYSIECKSYKSSDSFETLVNGNSNVFKWVEEAVVDSAKIGKIPMAVFKWNHSPVFAASLSEYKIAKPNITLVQNGVSIDIFYFDELLKQQIWVEKIEQK